MVLVLSDIQNLYNLYATNLDFGLIRCVNPKSLKGRIYELTERGNKALEKVREMEKGE
jgi:predicted transcriptional regulator